MLRKTITLAFLGPDGAGKSTYIKKISQNLKKNKINLVNYHLYPNSQIHTLKCQDQNLLLF